MVCCTEIDTLMGDVLPLEVSCPTQTQGGTFSLLAKILNTKRLNPNAIKETLPIIWNLKDYMEVIPLAENTVVYNFTRESDMKKIFESRPWSFKRSLILLEEWRSDKLLTKLLSSGPRSGSKFIIYHQTV